MPINLLKFLFIVLVRNPPTSIDRRVMGWLSFGDFKIKKIYVIHNLQETIQRLNKYCTCNFYFAFLTNFK